MKFDGWVRIAALVSMGLSLAWGWLIVEAMRALLGLPGCTPDYVDSTIFQRLLYGPVPLLVLGVCCYVGASRLAKLRG